MNKNEEINNNRDNNILDSNDTENSLAIGIGILADMTRIDMERSLSYFDINKE